MLMAARVTVTHLIALIPVQLLQVLFNPVLLYLGYTHDPEMELNFVE